MTTIYNKYYSNLQSGVIDTNNINYTALIVTKDYIPSPEHTAQEIRDLVVVVTEMMVGNELNELTMSEIIDLVKRQLNEEQLKISNGFVMLDNESGDLCWFENIDNVDYE